MAATGAGLQTLKASSRFSFDKKESKVSGGGTVSYSVM
jgi:hypothetical protein